ncbi:MAG: hypothetical protein JXR76_22905 [Deltaproteobacteria bacterium]|nr:hypothetical protein [Deltaproteobacteria bacterium]
MRVTLILFLLVFFIAGCGGAANVGRDGNAYGGDVDVNVEADADVDVARNIDNNSTVVDDVENSSNTGDTDASN